MALTWIRMPVDEAQAFFHRRVYTLENPATLFEAKFFAALLIQTGEIEKWSYADLAVYWGWESSERCRWTTVRREDGGRDKICVGHAALNRVRRLLIHIRNPSNLWTFQTSNQTSKTETTDIDRQATDKKRTMTRQSEQYQLFTAVEKTDNKIQKTSSGIPPACARGEDLSSSYDLFKRDLDLDQDAEESVSPKHCAATATLPLQKPAESSSRDLFKEMGEELLTRGLRSPWGLLQQLRTKYGNEYLYQAIEDTLDEEIPGDHASVKSRLLFHLARLTKTKVNVVMNGGAQKSPALPRKTPKKEPEKPKHILEIDLDDCAQQGCMFCQARVNESDGVLVYPKAGWMATEWLEDYPNIVERNWNGRP